MLRIGSIVLRVDDLQRQTEFWEAALDYVRRDAQSDDFVLLRPRGGVGPNLSLDQVPSKAHWDERPPEADYVILSDPEGNRFCVVDISR